MYIGRRHFIKLVGSSLLVGDVDAISSKVRKPVSFINRELGFGFKVPIGWHLETFRDDFKELLGGQKLDSPYVGDEELLEDLSSGLMATLSKYPITETEQKRFSPSVTFFRETDEILSDYSSLIDLVSDAISGFSEVLRDYECYYSPQCIDREDCIMIRSKSRFLFEHEEMDPVLIDDETFFVHHDQWLYTLHLYDSPYTRESSQEEFSMFKNSLHIA